MLSLFAKTLARRQPDPMALGAVLILLSCQAAFGGGPEEPRLKFLDDFFYLGSPPCQQDPFEERIETERHDFTQSTRTVGRGVIQLESGYTYLYKDFEEEIEHSHTTPELLARFGLSEDVEFRLRWNYAWRFRDPGENVDGAEDLRWSFKLRVFDQDLLLPEMATEIRFTAPTGGSAWTTEQVEHGLDVIYGWELTEGMELYGSTQYATNGLADFGLLPEEPASDRFLVMAQSVALGLEITEQSTVYIEYFGIWSNGAADNFSINVFNIGVDYYLTDDLVLDWRIGTGLTADSDDLFTGVGGGVRF